MTESTKKKYSLRVRLLTLSLCALFLILDSLLNDPVVFYPITESVRKGLYIQASGESTPRVGLYVLVEPTKELEKIISIRIKDRLPRLLKLVVAVEGDEVCLSNDSLSINGQILTSVFETPKERQHELKLQLGCKTIAKDHYYVVGTHKRSIDSKYFGQVSASRITKILKPLIQWGTDEDQNHLL